MSLLKDETNTVWMFSLRIRMLTFTRLWGRKLYFKHTPTALLPAQPTQGAIMTKHQQWHGIHRFPNTRCHPHLLAPRSGWRSPRPTRSLSLILFNAHFTLQKKSLFQTFESFLHESSLKINLFFKKNNLSSLSVLSALRWLRSTWAFSHFLAYDSSFSSNSFLPTLIFPKCYFPQFPKVDNLLSPSVLSVWIISSAWTPFLPCTHPSCKLVHSVTLNFM